MARALTIMMLVLGLSWACSKDQAPAMPGSGAVGKVVELAGDVTAKRGSDEPRALKVGETIYAKDTVTTGDDGSVTIVLEHNNARWTLAASKTQAVVDSLAAKAKKQEGSQFEQAGDDTTVTAGRNVENETASTAGTLARGGESAPAESASADDGAAAAPTTAAPR
ncbi:MAG: hypothetical protein KJO07_18030, partial [Deltaproteobacteria bacterium]|nr:hypothetical protein [Deltaproteobacteria bacterium]